MSTVQRAALYYRVSTEEQAKHGISLDAQRARLLQYAAENSMRIVGEYPDDGVSARKRYTKREKFMDMLDAVKRDEIDVILFVKLDRWFRNIADYYEVQRVLDEHNVQWIATDEDYNTTTANGRLHLNIKLSIAQDEADRTSERIKFVFEDKIRRGEVISGKIPLGYKIENKRLAINDDTAALAREIFDVYISLRSIRGVVKWLLDEKGKQCSCTMIRNMIGNEIYVGRSHGNNDFAPAIIDEKTFALAQDVLSQRSGRYGNGPRHVAYFTGLCFCKECGERMHTVPLPRPYKDYIYYKCRKWEIWKNCAHRKQHNQEHIEAELLARVLPDAMLRISAPAAKHKDNTPTIKRKLSKLKDLYLNDLIQREDYVSEYSALQAQLESEKNKKPIDVNIEGLKSAIETYNGLSKEARKVFWGRLVKRIIIDNAGNMEVEYRE